MIKEEDLRDETVMSMAREILLAARTAPKARGRDNLELMLCDKDDMKKIAERMIKMAEEGRGPEFFKRDAENILKSQAMLLLGCRIKPCGLKPCGMCGFGTCDNKPADTPCSLNTTDLGIALGSAVSKAADLRLDSRIMYSVAQGAKELGYFSEELKVFFALPLSVSGKSPFFDR